MKKLKLFIVLSIMTCLLAGCSVPFKKEATADSNGTLVAEDGRQYGGHDDGGLNDTMKNTFFSFKVLDANIYSTFQVGEETYEPEEGFVYLVCKMEVTNVYDADIPMSIADFELNYDDSSDIKYGYGNTDLQNEEFFDDEFYLAKGETVTKYILYNVPISDKYSINYEELWDDDFVGNSYTVTFSANDMRENEEDLLDKMTEDTTEETTGETTEATTEETQE